MTRSLARLALIALPCLFASCTVGPKPPPGELGRQFTATIPGTWAGHGTSSGIDARMVKQYRPDGTAKGVLMFKKTSRNLSLVMPEIPFTSRWRVKGDVVETYDIKTGVPGLFKKGLVIRDTILSVSPNRIVSRSGDSGEIEVLNRLNSISR